MKDLCHLNKKDCLKPEQYPQTGFCKDWNFTEQTVNFYRAFLAASSTVAKQLLNFCAEKGTSLLLLSWNIQLYWLLLSLLANPAFIKTQFLYHMVIQKDKV